MIIRLKEKYQKEVTPKMMEKFAYKSKMQVPKIGKVILNIGFGKKVAGQSSQEREKVQEFISKELSLISGQRSILTKAKKSIAGFKIRRGISIGAKVTLRGKRMYDFLERLIHIVLPRSRDFLGISQSSIDKKGHLTIGIKEHICFPEIRPEKAKEILGLQITVATTVKTREESLELFKLMGFPIKPLK